MCFQLGTSPPSRNCGLCHISLSCWFSPFVSSPRHDGSLREGFDVGFPCLRACVLHFAFFRLAPPATLAVRGRFLTGGLPYYSDCDSFNYFLRVFPGFIARTFRGVGVGFEEPHLRFVALLGEPKFPRVSHISAHAAHQDGLVLWYGLGRPVL